MQDRDRSLERGTSGRTISRQIHEAMSGSLVPHTKGKKERMGRVNDNEGIMTEMMFRYVRERWET